jgi:hypothetical protein
MPKPSKGGRPPNARSENPVAKGPKTKFEDYTSDNYTIEHSDNEFDSPFDKTSKKIKDVASKTGLTPEAEARLKKKFESFSLNWEKLSKAAGTTQGDYRSDQFTRALYHAMMASMIELIPVAEQKYLETRSEGSLYALNAAVNQIKGLSSDIRGLDDLEGQADHITSAILIPMFMNVTSTLLSLMQGFKGEIDSLELTPRKSKAVKTGLDTMLKQFAAYLQGTSELVTAKTKAYMVGD